MIRKVLLTIVLIGAGCLSQGCMLAAVGVGAAGTIAYVRGDLQTTESEPIDVVYDACLKALEQLELPVTSKSKDALVAQITSFDAQDKKIKIKLKAETDETTKLSIRIGTFGSETKSRMIYQKIRDNLKS
ncbi:MAG: DUF3568 family protein [Planctomycetota bacterium]|jgi:hypothetical protein